MWEESHIEEELRAYLLSQIGVRSRQNNSYELYFFSAPEKCIGKAIVEDEETNSFCRTEENYALLTIWPEKLLVPEWSLRLQCYVQVFPGTIKKILTQTFRKKFIVEYYEGLPLLAWTIEDISDPGLDLEKHSLFAYISSDLAFDYYRIVLEETFSFQPYFASSIAWRTLSDQERMRLWYTIWSKLPVELYVDMDPPTDHWIFVFDGITVSLWDEKEYALFWNSGEWLLFLEDVLSHHIQWKREGNEISLCSKCLSEGKGFSDFQSLLPPLVKKISAVLSLDPKALL